MFDGKETTVPQLHAKRIRRYRPREGLADVVAVAKRFDLAVNPLFKA